MASDTLCDLGKGSSLFCLVKSANLNRPGSAILFQDAFLPAGEEVLGLWPLEAPKGLFLASSDPCGYGHPALSGSWQANLVRVPSSLTLGPPFFWNGLRAHSALV